MNNNKEEIKEEYARVMDVYKQVVRINGMGCLLSNIGVLILAICGLLKSTDTVSSCIFVSVILFFVLENNLSLIGVNRDYAKVLSWYEEKKHNLENNIKDETDIPLGNWNFYIFSLVVELVCLSFGYYWLLLR